MPDLPDLQRADSHLFEQIRANEGTEKLILSGLCTMKLISQAERHERN